MAVHLNLSIRKDLVPNQTTDRLTPIRINFFFYYSCNKKKYHSVRNCAHRPTENHRTLTATPYTMDAINDFINAFIADTELQWSINQGDKIENSI